MGQTEVYEVLKKKRGRWISSEEIRKELPNLSTICKSLERLRHFGEVEFKLDKYGKYLYRAKRGDKNVE